MPLAGLAGRVVIVTGAASGIGRAVAERLVAEQSSVVLVDVDASGLERAVADLGNDRALGVVADVSTEEGTERYFSAARARFGQVDGLHANAGIAEPGKTLAETDPEDFDRTIAINVRGVFLGIRGMLLALAEQGTRGSLVTTASVLGLKGLAGVGSYCASKAAVISLTRTAAIEAGPAGHRVNAILPGPIATSMAKRIEQSLPPDERAAFRAGLLEPVPLGRFGQAHEVAALAAWLLSEESSYANGGIYSIDGGQSAG
jgi:NAD(P)-dependent dehydrogenase (short-subunit alcohol dehydrogenase family)